jgi:antitoxin component of RelBE/YafQ-DinJ toxin-antitoxin module
MNKKMYSFRLNKDLVDSSKEIAREMGISLSLFISCLLKEKVSHLNSAKEDSRMDNNFIIPNELAPQILREIVLEIKKLRSDLKNFLKISKSES